MITFFIMLTTIKNEGSIYSTKSYLSTSHRHNFTHKTRSVYLSYIIERTHHIRNLPEKIRFPLNLHRAFHCKNFPSLRLLRIMNPRDNIILFPLFLRDDLVGGRVAMATRGRTSRPCDCYHRRCCSPPHYRRFIPTSRLNQKGFNRLSLITLNSTLGKHSWVEIVKASSRREESISFFVRIVCELRRYLHNRT